MSLFHNKARERFWRKVNKDTASGCWVWMHAKRGSQGYGQVTINKKGYSAHRVSWFFSFGKIPPGACVLHKCDTPLCVNPKHLFLGTHDDNMADKVRKRRQSRGKTHSNSIKNKPRGELNHFSVLRDEQVRQIKKLLNAGAMQSTIAKRYGVQAAAISKIATGRSWGHLND